MRRARQVGIARRSRGQRGATLAVVLILMTVGLILLVAALAFASVGFRSGSAYERRGQKIGSERDALDFLVQTIRLAVNNLAGVPSIVYGIFGLGFFIYGKKQGAMVPLICGLVLMVYPYFVSNPVVEILIGVALIAVPYFVRL